MAARYQPNLYAKDDLLVTSTGKIVTPLEAVKHGAPHSETFWGSLLTLNEEWLRLNDEEKINQAFAKIPERAIVLLSDYQQIPEIPMSPEELMDVVMALPGRASTPRRLRVHKVPASRGSPLKST